IPGMLAHNLIGNRALPGNHQWIIEGMNEGHSRLFHQPVAMSLCFGVMIAGKYNLRIEGSHRFYFDVGSRLRHDDHRAYAQVLRRKRDPLRVVSCAGSNDADGTLSL